MDKRRFFGGLRRGAALVRVVLRENRLLPASLSTGWNLLYALFNGLLAWYYRSWWFLTLCAFYAMLGLMRLSVVTIRRRPGKSGAELMRHNGYAVMALSIVLSGMTLLTIRERQNPVRSLVVMIAIAAYPFAMVGWSIRNTVKARRQKSAAMITLRDIACAGAIGSILSLERAMLGTFGDAEDAFTLTMEAASGAGAFVLLIGIGLSMVLESRRYQNTRV